MTKDQEAKCRQAYNDYYPDAKTEIGYAGWKLIWEKALEANLPETPQHKAREHCPNCNAVGMYHCSDPVHCGGMKPMTIAEEFDNAYRAFVGAFDTPLARRKDDSEYANDARRRLRALHDRIISEGSKAT